MKRDLKRFRRRLVWLAGFVCCSLIPASGMVMAQDFDQREQAGLESMEVPFPVQKIGSTHNLPPVQYQSDQELQQQYLQTAATAINPRVAKMSRRLNNVSWEQFENKIVDLWGDQLQAHAEDEQGTRVRILIPGDLNQDNHMVIDRNHNAVTFEGSPEIAENWETLIDILDQTAATENQCIRLVGMGNASANTVRRAVALLGLPEEESGSLAEAIRFVPFRNSVAETQQRGSQLRSIPFRPAANANKKAVESTGPRQQRRPSPSPSQPMPPRVTSSKPATGSTAQAPRPTRPATSTTPGTSATTTRSTARTLQPAPSSGNSSAAAIKKHVPTPETRPAPSQPSSTTESTGSIARMNPQPETGTPTPAREPASVLTTRPRTTRKITYSVPATQEEGQEELQIVEIEDPGLDGQVKIQVIPEMNAIALIGSPEDVAKVRQMIEKIIKTAGESQPNSEIYNLTYVDSTTLKQTLDTVYEAGYEANNGPAEIIAISNPNSLFVVAQQPAQDIISGLIEKLDTESPDTDETLGYQIFRLKFISAQDAALRLQGYFRQAPEDLTQNSQPLTPDDWIAAFEGPVSFVIDYRSNSLIVKGNQRVLRSAERLIGELDIDESDATHVVRFFQLYNAAATDVAVILQQAVNGGFQGAPQVNSPGSQNLNTNNFQNNATGFGAQGQQSNLPVTALQMTVVGENGRLVKSGILLEVRFNADINSNQIMVTGPQKSMDLVEALIKQLDRIPDAETQIKVFTILNGDANELLTTLQTIFGSDQTQGGNQFGNQAGTTQTLAQLPLQTSSQSEGGSLINLRFAVDTRTNSILASGPAGDLQLIEDLLNRLDEADLSNRVNRIYRLSNAPAEDVSTAISQWLEDRQSVFDTDPAAANDFVSARRQVVVVPELVSNTLIISATPAYFEELILLIEELDRRPPMVKIKVLIAEVNLNKLSEFGVEVGIQDSLLFDRGLGVVGFPFNQSAIGNNNDALSLATREILAAQGLSNLGIGRTNGDTGYGGLVLSAGNESINILMRALQDRAIARVLSTPDIMTVDNLQGRIQVGQQVARVSGASQTNVNGAVTTTVENVDVGVILEVTPRVSPDGMIIMSVDAINSSLGSEADGVPVFANDNQVIRSPPINITQAQTTIMARSGQTVAFSGLIQDRVAEAKRGTPILSDLPVLGPLFSFESEEHTRSELLIVLTPYLIDSDSRLEASNQMSYSRMHWCEDDVATVYGGIHGYDPETVSDSVPVTFYPDQDPTAENPRYLPLENGQEVQSQEQFPQEMFEQPYSEPQSLKQLPNGRYVPQGASNLQRQGATGSQVARGR